ncbi:ArsO family NAD(P)H-dependent flavin-containing monooxygenase [Comamonas thiooxydans]|uniref:ArsO family NAD(P)H-dependent flavin-containing monooxygenase n=2 Tax=Comamonas TaxID=283 RepID=A0AA42Q193_9BURK|nr:ArsO family NAD(P)H-dependent flavin-containing monooxygenase [Comamonas thiooxydans]MDH1335443.1 ArsO family NAD(P)H-dependent flavin-containing monooxygenase [Comamonas thiooxydans]MDH1477170.1 ArsO family NAD(P)H-dependent flavin-containing monooxygenase [Comamonas thiooxydans]MDH1741526.1 ArsO family NAD(P)H-dependent flavin-containing monooxygenase [Comamonas thiooxydans]MDH1787910.1 ArsO family NAD(P)H-dependent flavin-containing monooxygenase [Comamonas thiooxydans]
MSFHDVIIVGAGQAGLSVAYFLRRSNLSVLLLDAEEAGGGAWQHGWDSLRLFSPASWSSIAGWPMPASGEQYPSRDHVVDYLRKYEARYELKIERPVCVTGIEPTEQGFQVNAGVRSWHSRAVVFATGTWRNPFVPNVEGLMSFKGQQLHSAQYASPEPFTGKRVMVVGGGNSGAQILAEVSLVAQSTTWVTLEPPAFLPDEVDGRVLFERATARWQALQEGKDPENLPGGFGDIVMVPPVLDARQRGVLQSVGPFESLTADGAGWRDGSTKSFDAVIWCTGFRPALQSLETLGVVNESRVTVDGTQVHGVPGLWLVGYGEWTGPASATLIGVMRTARSTASEITRYLLN